MAAAALGRGRGQRLGHQTALRGEQSACGRSLPRPDVRPVSLGRSEGLKREFKCHLAIDRLSGHRSVAKCFRLYLQAAAGTFLSSRMTHPCLPAGGPGESAATPTPAQEPRKGPLRRPKAAQGARALLSWRLLNSLAQELGSRGGVPPRPASVGRSSASRWPSQHRPFRQPRGRLAAPLAQGFV